MDKKKLIFIIGIILFITFPTFQMIFNNSGEVLLSDAKKLDNKEYFLNEKVVVGYCQAIEYAEAVETFYYTLKALDDMGAISGLNLNYKPYETTGKELWNYVCDNVESDMFLFSKEDFYDMDLGDLEKAKNAVENKNIDLFFTFGTAAGQEFFKDFNKINTINLGTNDPLEAGIIKNSEFSGVENLWARVDESRNYRQLKMFRDAVGYKKLGVIRYTDSFRRVFTPEKDIERLSKEEGFEVEIYDFYNVDEIFLSSDLNRYYDEIIKAHKYLANNCDAFYMIIGGWRYEDLSELLRPFYEENIPVFSQFGSIEVENGALMSVGKKTFDELGRYVASVVIRCANGEKLGEISQLYPEIQSMAYNAEVGDKINFEPDIEFLMYCNEIYGREVAQ
jgi:ABC-type uncharacterized transport system substrate-binding protein